MADSVTIQLPHSGQLPCVCPAAEPIAAVRRQHRLGRGQKVHAEVPGVQCRVVHEPVDLLGDGTSVGIYCCHPDAGYRLCPIWQFDKDLIAAGFKSMGDESVMEEENDAAYREDLTGSRYGDVSFIDALDESVKEAVAVMQDPGSDGFVRGES